MEAVDESELVRRLTQDDPTALEDAFRLYGARCNAVAYRVLGDGTRAEDAVQEAFLALWRHRKGLTVRAAGIAPWLMTVARNAALTSWRSQERRETRELRAAEDDPVAEDPFAEVGSAIESAAVRSALLELPPEQRAVIVLAYYQRLTLRQIAERTGAPLGTVKRRAQLALRALGHKMKAQIP